jgi:hypothetical protein
MRHHDWASFRLLFLPSFFTTQGWHIDSVLLRARFKKVCYLLIIMFIWKNTALLQHLLTKQWCLRYQTLSSYDRAIEILTTKKANVDQWLNYGNSIKLPMMQKE